MRSTVVPVSWVVEEGHRFDCGPFTRGGIEARKALESSKFPKDRLVELTAGGLSGMYHVGMDKLRWVEDAEHGIPILRSSDIQRADFLNQAYISRAQVAGNPLFTCPSGGTLITRSGTIGKMAYCRSDMAAMAMSQDVLKVVPDPKKVASGYLYAFLSSKYGVPLVVSGTFGSIIVHIEAANIAGLPVPRLGSQLESKVHELVERAASLRSEAAQLLIDATRQLEELAGLPHLEVPASPTPFDWCAVPASALQSRLDGFFHSRFHGDALAALSRTNTKSLSELAARIVEPLRFKRVAVEDPAHGVPFFGTSPLFWADPKPNYFVSRRMRNIEQYIVDKRCLLVPRSGQLSGIIGSVVLPYGDVVGGAVSEDAIRVYFESEQDAGYGLVALTSEYGRRQLKARAFGSSIPHLDVRQLGLVRVSDVGSEERRRIGGMGARVARLRDEACRAEREARALLEAKIEKGWT